LNRLVFSFLLLTAVISSADIPMPSGNIAQSKGLNGGVGFGTLNSSKCKTLFTWTGHADYSYSSLVSSGVSIKFSGGTLDSINSVVSQRYSLNVMFNKILPEHALYIGPVFSFDNTDLQELMDDFSQIGSSHAREQTVCSEGFSEIGASIGYKSGIGFLLTPDWGLSFGQNTDFMFSGSYLFSASISAAFNLRNQFEKLIENTRNVWVSIEYFTSFTKKSFGTHSIIFGLSLGF